MIQIILLVIVGIILLYIVFSQNKNNYESFVPMGANGRFLSKVSQNSTTNVSNIDKNEIVEEMKTCQPKPDKCIQEEVSYSPPPSQYACCNKYPRCGCKKQKVKVIVKETKCAPCVCKTVDLNRYVLKSSIPPCPRLPDMSQYILKSEIPPCPKCPDMSKYVLKSSIPPCPQCPTCPTCPSSNCSTCNCEKDCPVPKLKCKQIIENNNNKLLEKVLTKDNNNNDYIVTEENNNQTKYYTSEEIQEIVENKINSFKDKLNNDCSNNNKNCNYNNIPKPYDEYMLDDGLQNSYTIS